jgi:hypothetical protein
MNKIASITDLHFRCQYTNEKYQNKKQGGWEWKKKAYLRTKTAISMCQIGEHPRSISFSQTQQ